MRLVALLLSLAAASVAQYATVIFYGVQGPGAGVPIYVDGSRVCGKGLKHSHYCTELVPVGEHVFKAGSGHGGRVAIEAGKTYYFLIFVDEHQFSGWTLRPPTEAEATFALQSLKPQP